MFSWAAAALQTTVWTRAIYQLKLSNSNPRIREQLRVWVYSLFNHKFSRIPPGLAGWWASVEPWMIIMEYKDFTISFILSCFPAKLWTWLSFVPRVPQLVTKHLLGGAWKDETEKKIPVMNGGNKAVMTPRFMTRSKASFVFSSWSVLIRLSPTYMVMMMTPLVSFFPLYFFLLKGSGMWKHDVIAWIHD